MARQTRAGKADFSVTHYDALDRAFGGTLDLGDPGNVSDATVTEQSESAYDRKNEEQTLNAVLRLIISQSLVLKPLRLIPWFTGIPSEMPWKGA